MNKFMMQKYAADMLFSYDLDDHKLLTLFFLIQEVKYIYIQSTWTVHILQSVSFGASGL